MLNQKEQQQYSAMFSESKVTEIFFMTDEFCKVFNRMMAKYSIDSANKPLKRKYHRDSTMSDAEVMVIMI
ncbi:MAG: IS982 family transposase, partial [Bacteroidaceae bacterium]|nr:IS982 family transposase [Bacteroidaceae bacterium]